MIVIEASGLSKSYALNGDKNMPFEALCQVSFKINEGESVGIIGANGAGKSTLLKLLSDVTFPSEGQATIKGSFASLLEVGTGFHPDLSGRDNIFLNASVIGISKKETERELDAIIDFAGVGKFIHEPLRTYSSGMKLRLAFSVLAHLKTDIVALDEVLAVGDSMFQLKCIERVFDFKKQGRTILFVSHNLSAIQKLCERTLVIDSGQLIFDGDTDEAIRLYLNKQKKQIEFGEFIDNFEFRSAGKSVTMDISLRGLPKDKELDLGINIRDVRGNELYHFSNRFVNKVLIPKSGCLQASITFEHSLKPGNYPISIYIGQELEEIAWLEHMAELVVAPYAPHGFHNSDAIQGAIITPFEISVK